MAELLTQPRYSWPPSTSSMQATQSPNKSTPNSSTLRKGSKQKRGPRVLSQPTLSRYRNYSSSCGDLSADLGNQPRLAADQGAQGDGMHNQNNPKPKKVTFRKDIQSADHLLTDPSQAQIGLHHTENEDNNNNDTEQNLKRSSERVDGACSDKYRMNVSAFLKSIASEDGTEQNDNLILDAIRAGMLLELKRKDIRGSNDEFVCEEDCSVAHETEKKDVEVGGGNTGVMDLQSERFDSTLGGDKQSETGGNVKRHKRRNREENRNLCHLGNCTNTVENCKGNCKEYDVCENNIASVDSDSSITALSCCEVEYVDAAHTFAKKPNYPRREEACCDKLLTKNTEFECDVYEINNTPVSNNQTSGRKCGKGDKRLLAADFVSASTPYRIELEGDDFDGIIVGKMFVPREGDKFREVHVVIQNGDTTSTENNNVDHFQNSFPRLLGTNIVGKVFTMKIVSLVSTEEQDKTHVLEIAKAVTVKRSPVKCDEAGTSPNPSSCSLCLVEFTSSNQARSHYGGKAHTKRTFVSSCSNKFYCDACNITYTSRKHEEQHVRGRKHRARVESLAKPAPHAAVGPRSPVKCQAEPPTAGPLVCGLCSITTNSRDNLVDHLKSYKHLKKIETLKKCHGKETLADTVLASQSKSQQSPNKAAVSPLRAVTMPDAPASNAQAPRTEPDNNRSNTPAYPQPCHSKQAAHGPMPVQVPKSKFNLSTPKKMVRTVGTQFTNTNRGEFSGEVTRREKPLSRNKSMVDSHRCQSALTDYIECGAPSGSAVNAFGGKSWRSGGCKAGGCRSWKKRTRTI